MAPPSNIPAWASDDAGSAPQKVIDTVPSWAQGDDSSPQKTNPDPGRWPVGGELPGSIKDMATAAAEAGLHLATMPVSLVSRALGSTAGAIYGANQGQGGNAMRTAADWGRKADLTYQPRSQGGKDLVAPLDSLTDKYEKWAENTAVGVGEHTTGDLLPALTATALQVPLAVLGRAVPREMSPATGRAMAAGFDLSPGQVKAGTIGNMLASLANRRQLERDLSHSNIDLSVQKAKADAGLQSDDTLSQGTLEEAKNPHFAVVNEVKALPGRVQMDPQYRTDIQGVPDRVSNPDFQFDSPDISQTIANYAAVRDASPKWMAEKIMDLRNEANQYMRGPYDRARQGEGLARRAIADVMEQQLDRHINQQVQAGTPGYTTPDLIPRWQNSRTQLAKINDIQDSLDGESIDPRKLKNMQDAGTPLSGGLAEIADMQAHFPASMQKATSIRDHVISGIHGAGTGAGAVGIGHYFGVDPYTSLVGGMIGPWALRKALTTRLYQKYGLRPPPLLAESAEGAQVEPDPIPSFIRKQYNQTGTIDRKDDAQ